MEQLDSELTLERADRVRERRLGDEARRGGGRERALVDDRERVAQLVELHRANLWDEEKHSLGPHLLLMFPWETCTGSPSP